MADYRNRIIGLKEVRGADLKRNPRNWRQHPEGQKSALREVLGKVGYVGAAIGRETADGIELLDGHLRADLADDALMPVLMVDITDAEAATVLATYDPLSSLAITDIDVLKDLVVDIDLDGHAELRKMMTDLTARKAAKEGGEEDDRIDVPGMALQPHEHYDFLVLLASTTHEWNVLCDLLGMKPEKRRGRMGTAHAIRADKLIELLQAKKGGRK